VGALQPVRRAQRPSKGAVTAALRARAGQARCNCCAAR